LLALNNALRNNKMNNYKQQSIFVVSAVAMSLLLVAGTILVPIQSSYAVSRTNGFPDTPSLKHSIRDGVSVNLEHRDQHMNQENLCYRDNTCRQSDVGQNTLGNDNQVTGFDDQSDNIQQSTAAPTTTTTVPGNQTGGNSTTPTPTPAPTTATLTVIKMVSGTTNATSSNFTMHVTGNNPTPANFAGSSTGIDVTLSPGTFNVTETIPTGTFFNTSFTGDCGGDIAAGQHLTCTITNTALTCEECFAKFLTQTQITAVLSFFQTSSVADVCAQLPQLSEISLFIPLSRVGISQTTFNELVACIRAAGVTLAVS
jgi:hypothetical protein